MAEKVLCVDDDPNILEAYKRNLRKQFHIDTAQGPEEGLGIIEEKGPYAIVVSDMKMPKMDGVQFLAKVKEMSPDTVRVMLTGYADVDTAVNAVNEGRIFRFLTKPCPPETLAKTLSAGLEQYRLIIAERELLEKTLSRSVKVLVDILAMVSPLAFAKSARLRKYVQHITSSLRLQGAWQFELAAMLSQIGCVALPSETLEKVYAREALSDEERKAYEAHPSVGSELLIKIPRLDAVARMIELQKNPPDEPVGEGASKKDVSIALGAKILKTALDFDELMSRGVKTDQAADALARTAKDELVGRIAAVLRDFRFERAGMELKSLRINELAPGMVIAEDIRTKTGILLVQKGQEISELLLERLRNFWSNRAIGDRIRVRVPVQEF